MKKIEKCGQLEADREEYEQARHVVLRRVLEEGESVHAVKAALGVVRLMGGIGSPFEKGFCCGLSEVLAIEEGAAAYLGEVPREKQLNAFLHLGLRPALQTVLRYFEEERLSIDSVWVKADQGVMYVALENEHGAVKYLVKQGDDVPLVVDKGFCYLAVVKPDYEASVRSLVGPSPTFEQLLMLPSDCLTSGWRDVKLGKSGSVCHIPVNVGYSLYEVFTKLSGLRSWPARSVGALCQGLLRMRDGDWLDCPVSLYDVMAGDREQAGQVSGVATDQGDLHLARGLDDMVQNTTRLVVLERPFEFGYGMLRGRAVAVVFQDGDAKGFIPLLRLEASYVRGVARQLLTSDGHVGLICFDAEGSAVKKRELEKLTSWNIFSFKTIKVALQRRTVEDVVESMRALVFHVYAGLEDSHIAVFAALNRRAEAPNVLLGDWLRRNRWIGQVLIDARRLPARQISELRDMSLHVTVDSKEIVSAMKGVSIVPWNEASFSVVRELESIGFVVLRLHVYGYVEEVGRFHEVE